MFYILETAQNYLTCYKFKWLHEKHNDKEKKFKELLK